MSTGTTAVLPARYRMRRSADFGATVRYGKRAVQPNIVIHAVLQARQVGEDVPGENRAQIKTESPRIGLIVAKSVGTAVQRHRVARRLRHQLRDLLDEVGPAEHLVIRALPSSRDADSAQLGRELRAGLRRLHRSGGVNR